MLRVGIASRVGTRGLPDDGQRLKAVNWGRFVGDQLRLGFRTMPNALNGRCLCQAVGCQRFPKIESGSVVHGWCLLTWSRRMHVIRRAWILGGVVLNHLEFSFYRQTLTSCKFVPDISYLHQQAVVRTDWHLQSAYPP